MFSTILSDSVVSAGNIITAAGWSCWLIHSSVKYLYFKIMTLKTAQLLLLPGLHDLNGHRLMYFLGQNHKVAYKLNPKMYFSNAVPNLNDFISSTRFSVPKKTKYM